MTSPRPVTGGGHALVSALAPSTGALHGVFATSVLDLAAQIDVTAVAISDITLIDGWTVNILLGRSRYDG